MTAFEDYDELLAALERERDPKPAVWRMLRQRSRVLTGDERAAELAAQTAEFEREHPNAYGKRAP
ncbi:MAG: hypothetical protein JWM93_3987 [Frankiales bacterium]|nr:hypothetical protein [Frankiales bacterium]